MVNIFNLLTITKIRQFPEHLKFLNPLCENLICITQIGEPVGVLIILNLVKEDIMIINLMLKLI